MDALEKQLYGRAVYVTMEGGVRVAAEDLLSALQRQCGIQPTAMKVEVACPPYHFFVRFDSVDHCAQVVYLKPVLRCGGAGMSIRRWCWDARGTPGKMECKSLVSIEGLPEQAWEVETVNNVLAGVGGRLEEMLPPTDRWVLPVTAWLQDPSAIPKGANAIKNERNEDEGVTLLAAGLVLEQANRRLRGSRRSCFALQGTSDGGGEGSRQRVVMASFAVSRRGGGRRSQAAGLEGRRPYLPPQSEPAAAANQDEFIEVHIRWQKVLEEAVRFLGGTELAYSSEVTGDGMFRQYVSFILPADMGGADHETIDVAGNTCFSACEAQSEVVAAALQCLVNKSLITPVLDVSYFQCEEMEEKLEQLVIKSGDFQRGLEMVLSDWSDCTRQTEETIRPFLNLIEEDLFHATNDKVRGAKLKVARVL
ncbi:hypothetical protein ACQ4PT_066899 [Festuca glaucescens]